MTPANSDLTLFAIPKNFRGHIATIQRNAISSWTRLNPRPEIFLFGEEEGTAELARELGLRHFPEVARNEFGTPLIHDLFRQAEVHASTPLVGYVNADILLTDDFTAAIGRVRARHEKFMAVGRRWDLDWDQPLDFSNPGWAEIVRDAARRANVQRPGNFIDYFIFTRGMCNDLLPLAIGRYTWDNYLLWRGGSHGAALVDVSPVVLAIHQNHDYAHSAVHADIRQSPEVKRNRAMVGPWWHLYTIEDAAEILEENGAHPSHRHLVLMAKRLWSHPLTIFQLPWLAIQALLPNGRSDRDSAANAKPENKAIGFRWLTLLFGIPLRVRLPFGSQWIARNDACGRMILRGRFENSERLFIEQILKPGMVVLDIGAHHGYYSLLASQKVGPSGQVIAFEPSFRERRNLLRHLRLNACTNVQVEETALGETEGRAEFFIVKGRETGCNSLRPPKVRQSTFATEVPVARLDEYARQHGLTRVDFVKMDVEGAELAVLKGATEFLDRRPRPIIFCEVQDMRTRAWGYPAREIVDFLRQKGFRWYVPSAEGAVRPLPPDEIEFDGNFVAVPEERVDELRFT